jgi:hypothetical protein
MSRTAALLVYLGVVAVLSAIAGTTPPQATIALVVAWGIAVIWL